MGTGLEIAALAIAAAGTYYGLEQQEEAQDEAEKRAREAAKLQEKKDDIHASRERAKQVRQARAQRASALAQSQTGAGTGGSGLAGTQAAIGGQLGSNLNFLQANRQINKQLSDLNVSSAAAINRANTRAAAGQAVAGIATSAQSVVGPE